MSLKTFYLGYHVYFVVVAGARSSMRPESWDLCSSACFQAWFRLPDTATWGWCPASLQLCKQKPISLLGWDIALRVRKHTWFWFCDRSCIRSQCSYDQTIQLRQSFLCRLPHGGTRRKYCFSEISVALKILVSLCCGRPCIKVRIQLEMEIRSGQHCFKRYTDLVRAFLHSGDAGDVFVSGEATVAELNRYMESTDVSPPKLSSSLL